MCWDMKELRPPGCSPQDCFVTLIEFGEKSVFTLIGISYNKAYRWHFCVQTQKIEFFYKIAWYREKHLQLHLKPRITAVYSCVVIDTQKLIGMEFRLSSSFLVMFKMTSLLWLVVN